MIQLGILLFGDDNGTNDVTGTLKYVLPTAVNTSRHKRPIRSAATSMRVQSILEPKVQSGEVDTTSP